MNGTRQSEAGQIIVFMAIMFLVLLGFAALAIDTGMTFNDRRNLQNAADSAALAGAQAAGTYMDTHGVIASTFYCSSNVELQLAMQTASTSAIGRAGTNKIVIDNNITDQNGVQVICFDASKVKYLDVKVMVTGESKTAFAQLFYGGKLVNTVTAIARVYPKHPAAWGFAIVATCDNCPGVTEVLGNGTPNVIMDRGGLFSNGDLGFTGGGNGGGITVLNGEPISYRGGLSTGNAVISPAASKVDDRLEATIPKPDCSGLTQFTTDRGNLTQGYYKNGIKSSSTLAKGLYCIEGGITLTGNETLTGSDVTIMMVSGSINFGGTAVVNIRAPETNSVNYGKAIKGLLIYVDENNPCNNNKNPKNGCVDLQGGTGSHFAGTIYIPNGSIDFGGTPSVGPDPAYQTQIVAKIVNLQGTSDVQVQFDDSKVVYNPASLELRK